MIAEYEAKVIELADTVVFDERTARLHMDCSEAATDAQALIAGNTNTAQNQERYKAEHDALVARYDAAKAQLETVSRERQEQIVLKEKTRRFLDILKDISVPLSAFDEQLWQATAELLVVRSAEDVTVIFRSGAKIGVRLENK
ncbi:hypothetical protein FACS1894132_02150 [Clostridia bacterium]|nr:hypothetical protein FACS1894132_02150 [Clostridia bacterium]